MFNIPNLLTLGNLLCGCMVTICLLSGWANGIFIFFCASLLFDLLDGLSARLLKQSSAIGKELDSLADMVSFGFVPGLLLFMLIDAAYPSMDSINFVAITGFFYTAAAALRLAKFNIDDRQGVDFMGLNTPSASIAIVGLVICDSHDCAYFSNTIDSYPFLLIVITLCLSLLLILDLPMMSFKVDTNDKKRLSQQLILLIGGTIILIWQGMCGLPLLILWYILYSIILAIINRQQ